MFMLIFGKFLQLLLVLPSSFLCAQDSSVTAKEFSELDSQVQNITQQVIELNRDLLILQEELVFPDNSQVAVFLSMDVGEFFNLDAVQVKIDDKIVSNHLYNEKEVSAMHRGGVQRLYLGNLKVGKHELAAYFTGKGPSNRPYLRGTSLSFEKSGNAKFVELIITDVTRKRQPEFLVKQW